MGAKNAQLLLATSLIGHLTQDCSVDIEIHRCFAQRKLAYTRIDKPARSVYTIYAVLRIKQLNYTFSQTMSLLGMCPFLADLPE